MLNVPNKELKISKATCVTKFLKADDPGIYIYHTKLKFSHNMAMPSNDIFIS